MGATPWAVNELYHLPLGLELLSCVPTQEILKPEMVTVPPSLTAE